MNDAASGARIGVFICHCGGNISDVVDVKRVAEEVGKLPGVVLSTTHMFICSDPGQALVESVIKEHALDRVIVAACSPTLHQMTFRRAIERAGLNQFLFEHVNVREQVSWVTEDPVGATAKATRLVTAAVQRARHLVALDKRRIAIQPAALVIGGGVAGLVAARDLAQRGMKVTLVENRPFLGGRMAQLDTVFPTGEKARDLLAPLIEEVVSHKLITVMTNAQVTNSEGVVGDFRTRIRVTPRGVNERLAYRGNAIAACPEETVNEFDFGLSKRKAIYMAYPGCWPPMPAIDWHTCTKCGKCVWAVGGKGPCYNVVPLIRMLVHDNQIDNTMLLLDKYAQMERNQVKSVLFFGAGEVADLAYLYLQLTTIHLAGIIDESKKGRNFFGHEIAGFEATGQSGWDMILVTRPDHIEKAIDMLTETGIDRSRIATL
jgi:heterodisulfide reductase subunit A-like polyferredoxin